jgi:glycosyltransferase involved in cell wall biosynthesis
MKAIKVLHIIPNLAGGGAERQLVNVVMGTSRKEVDHIVCLIGSDDFFGQSLIDAGFKVIKFGLDGKHPILRTASLLRRVIKEEKPDVIHSRLFDANVSARLASAFSGIPLITSLEAGDYDPQVIKLAGWNPRSVGALKTIDKLTASLAKPYFVPCSNYVKNAYLKHFGLDEDRTRVIYNGVDPASIFTGENYSPAKLRDELELPGDAFIFLNVGRLDLQKNHLVLFKAFEQISGEFPNAYLLLAGIGHLEKSLKELARELGISGQVRFLGCRNDVGDLLELADVFVFPSLFEGHPVALIEAMFKSLPSVVSRTEVFEEVVTDGVDAMLVDPASVEELAGTLRTLYHDDELRRKLAKNAFTNANDNFHSARTASEFERLYLQFGRSRPMSAKG